MLGLSITRVTSVVAIDLTSLQPVRPQGRLQTPGRSPAGPTQSRPFGVFGASPTRSMNSTSGAWYLTACDPWVTIGGCSDEAVQAYAVWGKFLVAFDVVAFVIMISALIRRKILVEESFNTLWMVLLKLLLCLPMYVPPFEAHKTIRSLFCQNTSCCLVIACQGHLRTRIALF